MDIMKRYQLDKGTSMTIDEKYAKLRGLRSMGSGHRLLRRRGRAFLAKVATDTLGDKAVAFTAVRPHPARERESKSWLVHRNPSGFL
jgi:hypothetical protein